MIMTYEEYVYFKLLMDFVKRNQQSAYSVSVAKNTLSSVFHPDEQGRRRKMIAIGVLVVGVCACIGGIGFWARSSNSSVDSKTTLTLSGRSKTSGNSPINAAPLGSKVLSSVLSTLPPACSLALRVAWSR
jgi:hypothetical protein